MRASKPLIYTGVTLIVGGAVYDAAAAGGWIQGDGQDHTVSRVSVAVATAADASDTIFAYVNCTTGEEVRVPPRDHRQRSAQARAKTYPHQSYLVRPDT